MNFISLNDTLQGMNSDDLPEAAGALHQALNNFDETRPRWVEINKSSCKPLFNDTVSSEGMEVLLHAAGSERRHQGYIAQQIINYQQAGMDYSDTDLSENMSNLLYPRDKFTRPLSIGFDRNELIAFLNDNGIEHTLAPIDATAHKQQAQAEAVGDCAKEKENQTTSNKPSKVSTAKEVFESLKLLVIDEEKLQTLLFKNAGKTQWLSECKYGDGYDLPQVIKAHAKKGLLKEEYQIKFSDNDMEKALSVN